MRAAFSIPSLDAIAFAVVAPSGGAATTETRHTRYVDQGPQWTPERRMLFYKTDLGSQLIPLAWLKALHQKNGKPFLDGSLARYGFLPDEDPARMENLPIGYRDAEPARTDGRYELRCLPRARDQGRQDDLSDRRRALDRRLHALRQGYRRRGDAD